MNDHSNPSSSPAWRGIWPSLPTGFDAAGDVDPSSAAETARFAVDAGAHGLVLLGLAGEVSRLTSSERRGVTEAIVAEVDGAVPVLVGATGQNARESERLASHAEAVGAAGLVLPPPTAYRLAYPELVDFFVGVASATSLPVLIQDAPVYLDVALSPRLVEDVAARAANVVGVKLETGPEGVESWRAELGSEWTVFAGNGGMFLIDCLRAGADGVMPGVDTVDLQVAIYEDELAGRGDEAERAFARLLPLLVFEMQSMEHYNACAKYVLGRRGVRIGDRLRSPGPNGLSERSVGRLERYLGGIGIAVR